MKFKSHQVKGKGRGKLLGFPTINLQIPQDFKLLDGIYAVKVFIGGQAPLIKGQEFIGALHFGPVPIFNETQKTLEVFLVDVDPKTLPETEIADLEVETVKFLRPVLNFENREDLVKQIEDDVLQTRKILSTDLLGPLV